VKGSIVLPFLLFAVASLPFGAIAQSIGTFTFTGNQTSQRQFHTATLLPNGKVLLAGGFAIISGWPAWASAELYDPSTGTFAATSEMTAPRYFHTATLLPDGKVLIAGGNASAANGCFCSPLATAELYDPATGAFTATGAMTTARSRHTATLLNTGKVLIAGGITDHKLASAELYDPSTGTFTGTGGMNATRWAHTATLLTNGKVLMAGGRHEDDPEEGAEVYDPDSGTFSLSGKSVYPGAFAASASLLMDGKVLVALQSDGWPSEFAEVYDPSSGTFSATGKMTKGRMFSTSTLLPDGKVLIAGRDLVTSHGSADVYDPVARTFSTTEGLVTSREEGYTATLLPNGTVLMSGGWNCCGYSVDTAVLYLPVALAPPPALLSISQDGRGQGAILRAGTNQIVSSENPATAGEILEIYCTGLTASSVIPPQVAIGGHMAKILFFGKAPGFESLNQVNVRVPTGVASGPAVPVRLTYLGRPSNEVTVGMR
jgi:hypothetical protein